MDKVLNFLEKINLVDNKDFELYKECSDIKITKSKNGDITLEIIFVKPISPKIYLNLLENIKSLDNSLNFIIKNRFVEFDSENVVDYLLYYLKNNSLDDKVILTNIIKRKTLNIKNHILYFTYLNQNELFILKKNVNKLKSFLDICDFDIDDIDFELDVKTKDIQNYKKEQENTTANIISKFKNNIGNKSNTKFYKEYKNINKIDGNVTNIFDLIPEQSVAIIEGEIFKIESINTRNNFLIYKIYITDYTDSIIVKGFPKEKGLSKEILNSLKEGDWIRTKINVQVDIYDDNSLSGIISSLMLIEKPSKYLKSDNSLQKRIELITHTNMTAFEGLVNVEELFKQMNDLGYKTVAITDKLNCQSFPETMHLSKKYNIDVIYGAQFEMINNPIDIVVNSKDILLSKCSFVIFDLETTGLSMYYDKIIEFGAIKYEKGKIVDKVQFFIDPEINIPDNISSITKIFNKDVEGAPKIKDALIKILDFIGDSILIAHNGIRFDLPFLNCKLVENNMPIIRNPLIDTMQLSRALNENIYSHSLGGICRKMKIEYNEDEAHRADVDSEFLLQVWNKMANKLEMESIFNLSEINEKFQNDLLKERNRGSWVTVYCLKADSMKHFYELISLSLTDNYYGTAKIFRHILNDNRKHFLISNSPTEGEVLEKAICGTDYELEETLKFYDFITIAPISCFLHDIHRKIYSQEVLENATKRIVKCAKKLNIKVVASSDTYYLDINDKQFFNVYVYAKSIGGKRHRFYKYDGFNDVMPNLHFRTTDEMLDEFKFLNNKDLIKEIVIDNTIEISNKFEKDIKPIKSKLYSPSIPGAEDKLKSKIWDRAKEVYGEKINDYILNRINHEIDSIINNGFSMIYWFSHLLVKKSMDDGYVVGSRGSVGSSITAWLINISEVNPLPAHYLCKKCKYLKFMSDYDSGFDLPKQNCPYCNFPLIGDGHNIPFETFMGFKGDKIPDIDLNFSALYQAKAHEFIRNMFGKDKVLRAGTISTVATKTAFGYVKSYFESIGRSGVKNAEIARIAHKCENVKRTTGQHPGGIIVIPKELSVYDFTPINYPADDKSLDWYTTHFAFESLHDSLLKFDILGHDNPTVLKMLTERTGVNSDDIPNYDTDVMALFSGTKSLNLKYVDVDEVLKVGTNGVPEFGTNFVKEMLLVTRPQKFSDLIRISGLSHGTNVWTGNAKNIIEEQGVNISDVISCRDDIMVYLINKGVESLTAFKIMEDVRKGKGLTEEYIKILNSKNLPNWYIDSCLKIAYLYPKAHATAYVIMAWKIAWFKIHYPLHFYSSFLTIRRDCFDLETILEGKNAINNKLVDIKNRMNNPKTKALVKNKEIDLIQIYEIVLEMLARGFSIKNIDLNKSLENEFLVEGNSLIAPFSTIDGLGESVAKSIVEARNQQPFTSKEDLLNRTKITKTHFKKFTDLGVISHLEEDSQMTLFG
ncbi:PolC-type DNA polymerase III [Malacoplasma muris]|uniref:PolC-type DNA polymerase III n=1 Tax=Malacoplasma muris TaxID=2119 RepID=UPI00398E5D0C